jgi:hypothetical protein
MLRALVERAIADWGAEHRRGLRPFPLSDPELVADRVLRNLAGYGPLEPLLADDDVWEVMVNAPEGTFAESRVPDSGSGQAVGPTAPSRRSTRESPTRVRVLHARLRATPRRCPTSVDNPRADALTGGIDPRASSSLLEQLGSCRTSSR